MSQKVFPLLFLLFFLGGCTKSLIFYNSEPMPYSYHVICPGGDISMTARLISHKEIKEKYNVAYWPFYHDLEKPLKYKHGMKLVIYQVRLINPKRRKIRIRYNEIKDKKQASTTIYEGTLPLRSYDFNVEVESQKQEMWIEVQNIKKKNTCVTPRAIWKKHSIAKEKMK